MVTHLAVFVMVPFEDPPVEPPAPVGLTGERWEFFAVGLVLIVAMLAALTTWFMAGGNE